MIVVLGLVAPGNTKIYICLGLSFFWKLPSRCNGLVCVVVVALADDVDQAGDDAVDALVHAEVKVEVSPVVGGREDVLDQEEGFVVLAPADHDGGVFLDWMGNTLADG